MSPAPAPVGKAGQGSLTVADCPWPVLANICKHSTAQAAARHMADMCQLCQPRIANITVHRQLLKTTNAIRISRDALCAQIVGERQRQWPDIGHCSLARASQDTSVSLISLVAFVIMGHLSLPGHRTVT